jgi:hypothetical protein
VHEIAKVRGEDINLVARTPRVVGKGAVDATLPLHPVLVEAIPRWGILIPPPGTSSGWSPVISGVAIAQTDRMIGDNTMSSTTVTVRRDEEGNVHAHWVGSVTFHPRVYGDPGSFGSLINECVENFERELKSEINLDLTR